MVLGSNRNNAALSLGLFAALCIGYGLVLSCTPTTSAAETSITLGVFQLSAGWFELIVFAAFFSIGMLLLSIFRRHISLSFYKTSFLVVSVLVAELGMAAYLAALADFFTEKVWLLSLGAALRGLGFAPLYLAWLELFIDCTSRFGHVSVAIALSVALLVAGLVGVLAMFLSRLAPTSVLPMVFLGLIAASGLLIVPIRRGLDGQDVKHARMQRPVNMPGFTRFILFAFGVSMGSLWVVLFSIESAHLPEVTSAAFLLVSVLLIVGMCTLFVRRELQFGFALRWVMFLTAVGFLLVPLCAQSAPNLVAFFLSVAWAVQIMLFSLMPIQIATRLPVSLASVSAMGGALYVLGNVAGVLVSAGLIDFLGCTSFTYSAVATIVCIVLMIAMLMFPMRNADASVMGLKVQEEDELREERLKRRSKEVGEKWGLTEREQEVLFLLVVGRTKAQIAEELCISEETVKTHTKHIYGKLDVHSLRSLVVLVETGTSFDEDGAL